MLNDRNPHRKKDRVHRPRSIAGIVDIERINSNQDSGLTLSASHGSPEHKVQVPCGAPGIRLSANDQ